MEDETGAGKKQKDYDDRYYDLDDGFIDDGDMEDDFGDGLEGMMGGPSGLDYDMYDEDLTTNQQPSTILNMEYDPLADERKEI